MSQNATNEALAFVFRQAADLIEEGDLARACWRAADAAGILRGLLETESPPVDRPLCGLDEPTGRGFMLPHRTPHLEPLAPGELERTIKADLLK